MHSLVPGGRFVVAFEDISQLEEKQLSADVFRLYTTKEIKRLLAGCELVKDVCIQTREKRGQLFHCAVATR